MNIKVTRNTGLLLLGLWLIISGLSSLGLTFPGLGIILALLAIAAGVCILLGR